MTTGVVTDIAQPMILASFFFLILLTGEKTSSSELPELHDDHHRSNHSFKENPGGNTSSSELFDDQQAFNQSLEEMSGDNTSSSELFEDLQVFNQSLEESSGGDDQQANNQSSEEMSGEGDDISLRLFYEPKHTIHALMDTPAIMRPLLMEKILREPENDNENRCSFRALLKYLNLTKDPDKYAVSRPVEEHSSPTYVYVTMMIYAILDVRESDQTFISYVWTFLEWENQHVQWSPDHFCGLKHIIVPVEHLWMPDITIEEMIEKDKAPPSPNLKINHFGWVEYRNDQVILSTCRMTVYKFPFDVQRCKISYKSILHSDEEIELFFNTNDTEITEWSRKVMRTQYEWLFISMTVDKESHDMFGINQTTIIYTITMKRRSVLYIANFLLPVFFFLCLDLASLLISHRGGEKLSFKVTVLLAVTVMQLILNEILPCSSDRIPLIAMYCIGIFCMMLLSLMETIIVMYMMEKDEKDEKDNETDRDQSLDKSCKDKLCKGNIHSCFTEMKKWSHCVSCNKASADQTPCMDKEGSSSQLTEVSLDLQKVSAELGEIDRKMTLLGRSKEEEKPGYWTRMAMKIDKIFSIIYVISSSLFLVIVFSLWSAP